MFLGLAITREIGSTINAGPAEAAVRDITGTATESGIGTGTEIGTGTGIGTEIGTGSETGIGTGTEIETATITDLISDGNDISIVT